MKKLMIAAAVVCAAAFAQAAAIDWKVSVNKAKQTGGGIYDALAGGDITAYVFDKATWSGFESITAAAFDDALDSSGFVQNGSGPQGATYETVDKDTGKAGTRILKNDSWTAGSAYDFVYVLLDESSDTAKYAAVDVAVTARALDAGGNTSGVLTKSLAEANALTWNNVASDVPEPTSGLLLLLGVAGLALKRKRA